MPTCHRCTRTFPTAEVRRTTKGHVCKDAITCKRRLSLTRGAVIESDLADQLASAARAFDQAADGNDPLDALRALRGLVEHSLNAAAEIVQRAANETTLTQKQLATALGVPASTLRGMRGGRLARSAR